MLALCLTLNLTRQDFQDEESKRKAENSVDLNSSSNIINVVVIMGTRWALHSARMEDSRNAKTISATKHEGKNVVWRPRLR
jgi:hypothetical protein